MRCMTAALIAALAASVTTAPAHAANDAEVAKLVGRAIEIETLGGVAVALYVDRRTLFFNYGLADATRTQPVSTDSLFNLASVGKAFTATLLAQAVKRGEVALDDPVSKYVTELQGDGDITKVTLGELAS